MENVLMIFIIIAVCLFSAFTNTFVNLFIKLFGSCGKSPEEKLLISEIKSMKDELSKISLLDEFAKYAKLQRKIDKNKTSLTEKANSRIKINDTHKDILIKTLNAISGVIILSILWTYAGETIVVVPESWLYPLTGLLIKEGNISVTTFFIITRYTVKRIFTEINR